ncbi:MAG: hypothetical protein MJ072_05220, partial [Clostridia bacterium]|nr:hypothetical protein [Clostridia bacterium]
TEPTSWSLLGGDAFFTGAGTEQGENLYSRTSGGTTYTGVLINMTTETSPKFYKTNTSATLSGGVVTKQLTGTYRCYIRDTNGTIRYNGNVVTVTSTGRKTTGGQNIYSDGTNDGLLIDRYPVYNFSNGNNYMRIEYLHYFNYLKILGVTTSIQIPRGNYYTIWNGTDSGATTGSNFPYNNYNVTLSNDKNCTVVFNADGTCYMKYSLSGTVRYVDYNSSTSTFVGNQFNTSDSTKLCIYSVEATDNINFGRITFQPNSTSTVNAKLASDTFVLMPETSTTPSSATSTEPVYDVVSIEDLGWKNMYGQNLSKDDLHKKFSLTYEMRWDIGLQIGSYNLDIGSEGLNQTSMVAPIGSNGVEAHIPLGCIAFRINKAGTSHIRVIVACPVSEFFVGESDVAGNVLYDLEENEDYYFGLWHVRA